GGDFRLADFLRTYFKRDIEHWLRSCVDRKLAHVIRPCEFNFEPAASPIVTKTADLNVLHRLTFDAQRLDTVDTIANPFPATCAPVELRIEVAAHQAVH